MLLVFCDLGFRVSINLHFHFSPLNQFPNLGILNDEQGELFHQNLKTMGRHYEGPWGKHMMADYCWSIKQYCPHKVYKRMSSGGSSAQKQAVLHKLY
ncbi:hypothetical protein AVEN_158699-1 [Araneus ventricosus]|uniref:Uncharacterized protein n=1 Tax=Araneus ventricosus TaxID=182803 RepID=A0A4Y2S6T6_ARAVE|nr:hypothetical protein AVEN_158699-1 [Araneus ventricosus]